ncbi:MAG TPA: class I adenylate-forming enzyme family protein, partial [Ramlibacter sp.]
MNALPDHPPPPSAPPFKTIAELVREHAAFRPKQAAIIHGERRISWEQVDAMMDRVAASLQRDGVKPRQSIAIAGANSPEYLALFLGALRAGLAVAPLPTGATTAQLATMVADSGARHFFVDATVPPFETGARRIFMDASSSPSLEAWLLPHG